MNGSTPTTAFLPVYAQGDPGLGIGGYDLQSAVDRSFAFDYDSSGNLDHIVLYRPGAGTIWILCNRGGQFSPVYTQGDTGSGIGGYDLKSTADRAFAFDYEESGKLDHLVLYRPGTGTIWILRHDGVQFSPVYAQGDPGNGIGGYDLKSTADRAFAFDYNGSGKLDHLAFYRPGTGTIWILSNRGGQFSPVYAQGDPGDGIGGYDLKSPADLAFAFDYEGSGKLDHLVLYRPGTGTIWILHHDGVQFSPVYAQGDPGNGIGGYDLKSTADRAFAFDYNGSGRLDHLALYCPGTGTISILSNHGGQFSPVYAQGNSGDGIGQYDLKSPADLAFAFDYDHSGTLDHLALYRPGTGTMWLLAQRAPVASSPVTPSPVTPSPVTSSPVASLVPGGVITGAVVGGIVCLTAAILVILFLCRRQQQTKNMSVNQPYRDHNWPHMHSSSVHITPFTTPEFGSVTAPGLSTILPLSHPNSTGAMGTMLQDTRMTSQMRQNEKLTKRGDIMMHTGWSGSQPPLIHADSGTRMNTNAHAHIESPPMYTVY